MYVRTYIVHRQVVREMYTRAQCLCACYWLFVFKSINNNKLLLSFFIYHNYFASTTITIQLNEEFALSIFLFLYLYVTYMLHIFEESQTHFTYREPLDLRWSN